MSTKQTLQRVTPHVFKNFSNINFSIPWKPFSTFNNQDMRFLSNSREKNVHLFRESKRNGSSSSTHHEEIHKIENQIIYTVKFGSGSHPVFVVPGAMGLALKTVKSILKGLDLSKFTVYSWDQPGYGKSVPPVRSFSNNDKCHLYQDIPLFIALLKKLGHQKYSLLGWSHGGSTVCGTAASNPELVQKLVIWGGFSRVTEEQAKIFQRLSDTDSWSRPTDTEKHTKYTQMANEVETAPYFELYGKEFFKTHWAQWLNSYAKLHTTNKGEVYTIKLSQIKCPLLVIHGDEDDVVTVDNAYYMHENVPRSKLLILRDAGHDCHQRRTQDFNEAVQNFLLNK